MKKFTYLFIILVINLNFTQLSAQTIAYANIDFIIQNSEIGKKIIIYYKKQNDDLVKLIKNEEKEIRQEENKLYAQKNILEANEFAKRLDSIKNKVNEFNKVNQEKIKNLNTKKDKTFNSLIVEIKKILNTFAKEKKIDMILSSKQIIIGKSNFDVTEDILKIVNEKIKKFDIEK